MSRFTAGPWVAIPSSVRLTSGAHRPIFDNGLWHILPESNVERLPIGVVDHADDHYEPCRERAEYDALLMAAAPDLLEACKLALSEMEQCGAFYLKPAEAKLRAAIAKAEGRS